MLQSRLSWMISVGMHPEDNNQTKRQIKATNSSILLGIVVFLFFMPVNYFQGNGHIVLKMTPFVGVLLIAYILSAKRFFNTAWVLSMLSVAIFCFLCSSYWLVGKRSELFLIVIMTMTILFFTSKWLMIFSGVLSTFFYILPQILYSAYSQSFGYFVFSVQFTVTFLIVYYFKELFEELIVKLNKQRELELEDKKLIIQQATELERLYEMKSNFLANVSHELKTPLTLIVGNAERLELENPSNATIHKRTNNILKNAKYLHRDIEDILDASKLEFGQLDWKLEPTYVIDYLQKRSSPFNSLAEQKKIHFDITLPKSGERPIVLLDRKQFSRVINNLLSNAFKFSSTGSIEMKLQVNKGQLIIEFRDSGIGIPKKELPFIFDRFYRGKATNKSAYSGTGIGLSLAKEIVEHHQGSLSVSSQVGIGSVFKVQLPTYSLVESNENLSESEETVVAKSKGSLNKLDLKDGKKIKWQPSVLLVDDNDSLLEYLEEVLEGEYHIHTATDGKEALVVLKEHKIDLLISDIMMPEMDGYELAEYVKKSKQLSDIPIILLTAKSLEEDRLKGLRIGIDDYLTKPFLADELIARTHNLISNRMYRIQSEKLQQEEGPTVSKEDGELILQFERLVKEKLNEKGLNVTTIARELGHSERQLYRKIGQIAGFSPNNLIKEIRLREAYEILQLRATNSVKDVSYKVGFDNPSYFSKEFKKRFGKKPGDMI